MIYAFKLCKDRVVVREKKSKQIVMQLSFQQIDILERLSRDDPPTSRKEIRKLVLRRPNKYNKYGYPSVGWQPLSNTERASYTRSISRLEDLGLVTSKRDPEIGLYEEITALGEELMMQFKDVFTLVRSGIKPIQLTYKSDVVVPHRQKNT